MHVAVFAIAAGTIALMLVRPFRLPEWIWPALGAALLVVSGLLPAFEAGNAARDGLDVYAFLAGMLVLAEIARVHGVFDVVCEHLGRQARGGAAALFTRLFLIAVGVTAVLRWHFRGHLNASYEALEPPARLTAQARLALIVVMTSLALLVAAAGFGRPIGYVALSLAAASLIIVSFTHRGTFSTVVREAPWSIIPLVAALFAIVRAIDAAGALEWARAFLRHASSLPPALGSLYAGSAVTLGDTLLNNLPVGVVVRYALRGPGIASYVVHAALVGVDLGPNLSISASLATLLWVMILRRDGIAVSARHFLALGALVTLPSLALALLVLR